MAVLKFLYAYIRILSLDIVAGSVVMSSVVSRVMGQNTTFSSLFLLASSVWLIYTTDHLIDAHKIKATASTGRHRFHQKNFKIMCVLACIVFCASVYELQFIDFRVLIGGIGIGILVVAYLVSVLAFNVWNKELIISVLYTSGVFLYPLAMSNWNFNADVLIAFIQLAGLAFANLIMISIFDADTDKTDNQNSIVLTKGMCWASRAFSTITLFNAATSVFVIISFHDDQKMLLITSGALVLNLLLSIIFSMRSNFQNGELFGFAGDAIF